MSGEGVGEAYVPREVRPRWESGEVGQDRFTGAHVSFRRQSGHR